MSYLPTKVLPHSPLISFISEESGIALDNVALISAAPASTSWPTNNKAIYEPFRLRYSVTVYALWVANGGTASGNIDIGIYAQDGTKILSTGSTAQAGTNVHQVISTTATTIGPGQYYMALALSSTVGTVFAINSASKILAATGGMYLQLTAFPLPATATFATYSATSNYIPLFGLKIVP